MVSAKVRALLSRHGASDHKQQLPVLMTILEASYSQAYRKLSGRSAWLDEDLHRIAHHFGETLGTLFSDSADGDVALDSNACAEIDGHAARIMVGNRLIDCRVMLHQDKDAASQLVLDSTPHGLRVVTGDAVSGQVIGPVRHVVIEASEPCHGGVAVLDDDPDVADSIVDNLLVRGLDAQAYYRKSELLASTRRYDTYILDWYAGDDTTTLDLVQHLRAGHAPQANIVILTGQINRGSAESDLAGLIHSYGVLVEIKPIRLSLLLAKLEHARVGA